jgi:hypothetical protein
MLKPGVDCWAIEGVEEELEVPVEAVSVREIGRMGFSVSLDVEPS